MRYSLHIGPKFKLYWVILSLRHWWGYSELTPYHYSPWLTRFVPSDHSARDISDTSQSSRWPASGIVFQSATNYKNRGEFTKSTYSRKYWGELPMNSDISNGWYSISLERNNAHKWNLLANCAVHFTLEPTTIPPFPVYFFGLAISANYRTESLDPMVWEPPRHTFIAMDVSIYEPTDHTINITFKIFWIAWEHLVLANLLPTTLWPWDFWTEGAVTQCFRRWRIDDRKHHSESRTKILWYLHASIWTRRCWKTSKWCFCLANILDKVTLSPMESSEPALFKPIISNHPDVQMWEIQCTRWHHTALFCGVKKLLVLGVCKDTTSRRNVQLQLHTWNTYKVKKPLWRGST